MAAHAALGLAALLFGTTFVVVKRAVEVLPPLAFVGWRFLIGGAALGVLAMPRRAGLWRDGVVAGTFLFAGYALQTGGLTLTTAGNSAFITGLYVVITPLLGAVLARRLPPARVAIGATLAAIGLALLTLSDGLALGSGDLLTLGCAAAFAAHIVVLAKVAHRHPVIPLTAVQLLTTAVLALAGSWWLEGLPGPAGPAFPAVVMTGLGVSAGAYLLQVWAQHVVSPSRTALVLTLEPVFGALAAAVLLGERLTGRGWAGAVVILLAILIVVTAADEPADVVAAEAVSAAR